VIETNDKSYCDAYKGAVFDYRMGRYYASVSHEKKKHSLGGYTLAADAAFACDECANLLGLSPINFQSKSEYTRARKKESKERGINVPPSEFQEYLTNKLIQVVSEAASDFKTMPNEATLEKSCDSDDSEIENDGDAEKLK